MFYAETRPPVLWTGKTKCGQVLICVDGSGQVKRKKYIYFFLFLCIKAKFPVRRTAQSALQSALHVMLLSYYIGMCISWASTRHLPSPRVLARFREGRAHVLRQATFWSCIKHWVSTLPLSGGKCCFSSVIPLSSFSVKIPRFFHILYWACHGHIYSHHFVCLACLELKAVSIRAPT